MVCPKKPQLQVDTLDLNAEELCKSKGGKSENKDLAMKLWEYYHTPQTYWVSKKYLIKNLILP